MILHGIFLCITSFVVGVILTWLFFAWVMDRKESSNYKIILRYLEVIAESYGRKLIEENRKCPE